MCNKLTKDLVYRRQVRGYPCGYSGETYAEATSDVLRNCESLKAETLWCWTIPKLTSYEIILKVRKVGIFYKFKEELNALKEVLR